MKVLVAGGTGVLGRAAVPLLTAAGHRVDAVARSDDARRRLEQAGARAVTLDVFDAAAVSRAAEGADVVMNLATAIPSSPLPPRRWAMNHRLRREASAAFATAALAVGARLVQESFAAAYPDRGADWIDEATPLDPVDQVVSVVDAEAAAARVSAAGGAAVVLRFGLFYGAGSAQTQQLLDAARRGVLMLPGAPDAYASMVHVDDAAAGVLASLALAPGTYNVVEDRPLTRREHAEVLAGLLGRRRVRLLPAVVGRLPVLRAVARSQRMSNAALRAGGWAPQHPSVAQGWPAVLAHADA